MGKYWRYGLALAVFAVAVAALVAHTHTPHTYRDLVPVLLGRAWHALLFGVMWCAVYFAGKAGLKAFRMGAFAPPELAAALGIIIHVVLATVLAAAHIAYSHLVGVITTGVFVAGVVGFIRGARSGNGFWRQPLAGLELGPAVLIVFGAMLTAPLLLAAVEPPIYWDALTYHLAVPKAYARAHGFIYLPHNVYASMPLGGTMFYLWATLWDGYTCANASYFVVSLLAVMLTYRLARAWLSQFYAAVAAALVLFTPVFYVVMPGAHVDHFLLLFALGALYVYLRIRRETGGRRTYVVWGIFLGAALAVKYTSIYVLAGFAPVLVYDALTRRVKLAEVGLGLGVALALVLPWLLKAYIERGNPFFPLFYASLGGRDFSTEQARRLVEWQAGMGQGRGFWDYVLLPYRISTKADFNYRSFAGLYLPYLLPLAGLGMVFVKPMRRLAAYVLGFGVAWALGPQQLRFLSGALGGFGILAAGAWGKAEEAWGPGGKTAWQILILVFVVFTGLSFNIGGIINSLEGFEYIAGKDRETFLIERCGFYMAQKQINECTPPDAKILMIFTNHTLYLEREAVYDSFFEASAFLVAAEKGADADGLYLLCRRWGVDYVHIFHLFENIAWQSYSPRTKQVFEEFIHKYGVNVYSDAANDVYELYPRTG